MPLSHENAQALNEGFLKLLEAHFPHWLQHVRRLHDEAGEDYVEVIVPAPEGMIHERPLEISTWGEEVTVAFGDYHTHFPWPKGYDGSDSDTRVVSFVQSLLNEEIIISSVWIEGRMKLGSMARPDELAKFASVPPGDHELRIASWRGTYDRSLPVDWHAYLKASHP
jgi:hypothetical protein